MNQFNQKQSNIIKVELAVIAIINLLFWLLLGEVDIFERIYYFTREHEQYDLDEFIPLMAMLLFSFLIFAFRRWKEASEYATLVEKQTRIDELTGLYNRRAHKRKIAREFIRFRRYKDTFAIINLSLDEFHRVADQQGGDYADQVLKTIAQRIQEHLREVDVCSRWSCDTFSILCPVTLEADAQIVAKKLSVVIAEPMSDELVMTASFGIMGIKEGILLDDVVKVADVALYQAKSQGKGSIVVAGD